MSYPAPTNVVYHDDDKTITFDIVAGHSEGANYGDPGYDTRGAVVCPSMGVTEGNCGGCGGAGIIPHAAKLGGNDGDTVSFTIPNVIANVDSYKIRYGLGYESPPGTFQCNSSEGSGEALVGTGGTVGPIPTPAISLPPLAMLSGCGDCAQYVRWLSPPSDCLEGTGAAAFRLLLKEIPDPTDPDAPPLPEGTDVWGEYRLDFRSPLIFNQGQPDVYHAYRLDGYRYLSGIYAGQDRYEMPTKKWFQAKWQFQDGACDWHDGEEVDFQQPWVDASVSLDMFAPIEDEATGLRTLPYVCWLRHGEGPHTTSWETPEGFTRI